ncbi:succinate dehydrogenase (ubiquinone) cytochrome b subunit [Talaromyces islandicus]|uniref:Succinate dehydrogenase (Ubiquinone) cytochrome b subunit n=1 Tax=Talaromyces islandicus TaxID=28573 RepID=A0A0U1LU45_TALIS|nr:succinate dehydrogenase (ubiquinone) cytochrome b subunit [Talaromyces islandicus]
MLSKTVPRGHLGIRPVFMRRAAFTSTRSQSVQSIQPLNKYLNQHYSASASASATGKSKLTALEQQRLRRPVSPHLTIYKWEYQSLASILQRFSGMAFSGGLYAFATAYLIAPSFVDVDSIASAVAALPDMLKTGGKFLVAWPFAYHAMNGVKQLAWDRVIGLRDRKMIRAVARGVAGVSFVGALGLALL